MPNELVPMIIPTVMIPLTLVSVGISVVASFIAALFGIELKLEGPKKLLEVLLKPKVLATAFLFNAIILSGVYAWKWWMNYPKLISTIEREMEIRARPSEIVYSNKASAQPVFKSLSSSKKIHQGIDQLWHLDMKAGAFRAPTIVNGRAFSGNKDGIISEIDLASGEVIRTFFTGTMSSPEVTIWNNSLYVGEGVHDTHHARVYRFDLKSGKLQGSYQTLGHTEGQAIVGSYQGEDTLFVVGGFDGLHAVDPLSMKLKWKVNPGHMDAAVVLDDGGRVFFGTGREKHDEAKYKSYAVSVDFKTGQILWKQELPASSWMRPVVINQDVCFVTGEVYFPSEKGHLACFDRMSGEHSAGLHTSLPLVGMPKALDNDILYTSLKGHVCRFDVSSRRNRWCFNAKMKDSSFAGASYYAPSHVVLYPSVNDGLYILDADTGEMLMNWKANKSEGEWLRTVADVAVEGDLWIVSDYEGTLRALRPRFLPQMAQDK